MFDSDLLFAYKNLTSKFCQMKPAISIIVPAFEEQDRLGDSVRTILRYIESEKLSAELIIVDDGSGDKTAETGETVCAEFPDVQTKVIRYEKNRGKGFAVKTGLLAADADIAIFSDADQFVCPIQVFHFQTKANLPDFFRCCPKYLQRFELFPRR